MWLRKLLLPIIYLTIGLTLTRCHYNDTLPVETPCRITISISDVENATNCFTPDGSFIINLENASESTIVKVNEIEVAEVEVTNRSSGFYLVSAVDKAGCNAFELVEIKTKEVSGVSWSESVQPILVSNCYFSGCHNGTTGRGDFSNYESVKEYSLRISAKTQGRSMPPGGELPEEEIQLIKCWVDDGALEN